MARKTRVPINERVYDLRNWSSCELSLRAEPVVGGVLILDLVDGREFNLTREDIDAAIEWLFRVRTLCEGDA